MYFAGIDGGASKSIAVLVDHNGEILAQIEGLSTQLYLVGAKESADRIIEMVNKLKIKFNLPMETQLQSIGISISGGNDEELTTQLITYMKDKYSNISKHFVSKCDSYGPVATCSKSAGIVLIAGTGSFCEFFNGNRQSCVCGGWGHLLGDKGSGYWVAKTAIKTVINHDDNFKLSEHDISLLSEKIFEFFNLDKMRNITKPFYSDFKKSTIAGFCKVVAELASKHEDPLAIEIFRKAGQHLANHVAAILPKLSQIENGRTGPLLIVCAGSLWKSWDLLKVGFLEVISPKIQIAFVLVKMKVTSAYGAVLFGASESGIKIETDLRKNYEVIYSSTNASICK